MKTKTYSSKQKNTKRCFLKVGRLEVGFYFLIAFLVIINGTHCESNGNSTASQDSNTKIVKLALNLRTNCDEAYKHCKICRTDGTSGDSYCQECEEGYSSMGRTKEDEEIKNWSVDSSDTRLTPLECKND